MWTYTTQWKTISKQGAGKYNPWLGKKIKRERNRNIKDNSILEKDIKTTTIYSTWSRRSMETWMIKGRYKKIQKELLWRKIIYLK